MKYNCPICDCVLVTETDLNHHLKAHKDFNDDLPSMNRFNKDKITIKTEIEKYRNYLTNYGRGYQNKISGFDELQFVFSYDDPEWLKLGGDLKAKNNYQCQLCGNPSNSLQAHHRIPVKHDPSKAFDVDNILVLCKKCHTKIHNGQRLELKNYASAHSVFFDQDDYSASENHRCDECGDMFYGPLYRRYCPSCWRNHHDNDY